MSKSGEGIEWVMTISQTLQGVNGSRQIYRTTVDEEPSSLPRSFSWSKGRFSGTEYSPGMQGALKMEPSMTEGMVRTNTVSHRRITAPVDTSVQHILYVYVTYPYEWEVTYSSMPHRSL